MDKLVNFGIIEKEKYSILIINLSENIEPSILRELELPKINHRKGLIITGRAPIWLYAFLVHYYHPTPFIALYDPRLGAVVVQSHVKDLKVGDVLDISFDGRDNFG
ncbi:MAG: CRISPR-associated protein Csx3 [Dictyoglomus sp. NZ13-RE01]|nr:MAG: CRISPR-associated protein Csx3 [Dictyoglomus sp. NZ13-RE01]